MRDDDILRRIELWATGATIHDAKGLIGHYRTFAHFLDNGPDEGRSKEDWERCRELARKNLPVLAATMEDFMRHGDYRKARRDNPLPDEVTRVDFPWSRVQTGPNRFNYVLARMPTNRTKVVAKDGRAFNLGVQETVQLADVDLNMKTCALIELHYARWDKLPGWSKQLFDGVGGDEMYDDWYQRKEKV